ncbi:MAG: hypothetical protein WCJ62_07975 [Flavobacterium sp.]
MKNTLLIFLYSVCIIGTLIDIYSVGFKNARIFEIISMAFFGILLFYKIKEVVTKKDTTRE